jgi:hypothetical protein
MATINENTIIKVLCNSYNTSNIVYKLSNALIFKSDWESDFFIQKRNGYSYEFEVKINRADFFNDKKKITKHLILSEGKYTTEHRSWKINEQTKKPEVKETILTEHLYNFRPNKFFYVVPKDLIKVDEIPKYAGLIYFSETTYPKLKIIKQAPFIHKNKLEFENVLCRKFYNYWLNGKNEIMELNRVIEELKLEIKILKNNVI